MTRRTALALGAKGLGTLALGTVTGCTLFGGDGDGDDRPYLDLSDPDVVRQARPLRLTFADAPLLGRTSGSQTLLFLGSSRDADAIPVTVSTVQRRTRLGRNRTDRGGDAVELRVSSSSPAGAWVTALGYGEPQQPGDRLRVQSLYGELFIEVWIEPTAGQWRVFNTPGRTVDLGIVGVHAALMRKPPDGEIIYFSPPRNRAPDGTFQRLAAPSREWSWNAQAMRDLEVRSCDLTTFRTTPRPLEGGGVTPAWNLFCSGHAHLGDGRLMVAGGHIILNDNNANEVHLYDASLGAAGWTRVPNVRMRKSRWYPTVTTLPDGRMLITSGSGQAATGTAADHSAFGFWAHVHNDYELFDPATMQLLDVDGANLIDEARVTPDRGITLRAGERVATYPAVFVVPGPRRSTTVVIVETNRAWTYTYVVGALPADRRPLRSRAGPFMMATQGSRSYPHYGSVVLLPYDASATRMRILALGGQREDNDDHRDIADDQPATATAEILELDAASSSSPRWRGVPSMYKRRILCDATLLADGRVLVSGGAERGWTNRNSEPVLDAELFDPETETFLAAARTGTDRRYHATALLLPDATVFKAGSHGGFPDAAWMQSHLDGEQYYPGYLWRGPRPEITEIRAGASITVGYDRAIEVVARGVNLTGSGRVALARYGSVTHGNDMDQRYVRLEGRSRRSGDRFVFRVQTPANPASAPPGDYMVFVLDDLGVPSKAGVVRLGTGGSGAPEQPAEESTTSSSEPETTTPETVPPPVTEPTPVTETTTTEPGVEPKLAFTVLPVETKQQCVAGAVPQFELLLDNRGSNVSVRWAITATDVVPGTQDAWATFDVSDGQVGAGAVASVVVSPSKAVCGAIKSPTPFRLVVVHDGGELTVVDTISPEQ